VSTERYLSESNKYQTIGVTCNVLDYHEDLAVFLVWVL